MVPPRWMYFHYLNFRGKLWVLTLFIVTSLPKCGKDGHNSVMIVCCHLTKMAHFIPCTDKITAEESADLFLQHV